MGAKRILINNLTSGTSRHYAGSEFDATSDAAVITQLEAAGGKLLPKENPAVASAMLIAANIRVRGGAAIDDDAISDAFTSALLAASVVQGFDVTLASGIGTVNTGITVTAQTRAMVQLKTPTGTLAAGGVKYALTVGAPGTGAIVVTAIALDGTTVTTDNSVYSVVLTG